MSDDVERRILVLAYLLALVTATISCAQSRYPLRTESGVVKVTGSCTGVFHSVEVIVCCEHGYCRDVKAFDKVEHEPRCWYNDGDKVELVIESDPNAPPHGSLLAIRRPK